MGYQHTQFGYLAPIVLVLLGVFFATIGALADLGSTALVLFGLLVLALAVVVINFNRLTTTLDEGEGVVDARFGWGWPSKRIPFDQIVDVEPVRNKWWYGWGIRFVPGRAWIFNVWGLDAVELRRSAARPFRIGTDEPAELADAIRGAVERHAHR